MAQRSDSKLRALARTMRTFGFVKQRIELTFGRVLLDLSIPLFPVTFEQPLAQLREFVWSELFDFLFQRFDSCHGCSRVFLPASVTDGARSAFHRSFRTTE